MAEHMTAEQLRAEILKHVEVSRMIAGSLELSGQRVAATHAKSSIPFLESIAARLSGMAAEWQPIETAPKDRRVELWIPNTWTKGDGRPSHGRWDDDRYARRPRPFWNYDLFHRISDMRDEPPTHWREPAAAPEPPHG